MKKSIVKILKEMFTTPTFVLAELMFVLSIYSGILLENKWLADLYCIGGWFVYAIHLKYGEIK